MSTITLSLVSHTNVGKTTLARTLLGADVGEVRDAPHVTEFADGHELIATEQGDRLRLWDTPGFGDSARLARRLLGSSNPIGWFLSQVWDRWADRGFWASQQAMRHVQAESDVVLYLVNASESPAAAGYVAPEMDLLSWVGKPVLVLLNQLGEPQAPEREAADVAAWRAHLARWAQVCDVLPLDAFARCWVHEQTLLRAVQQRLQGEQQAAMARLTAAWAARNQVRFDASMALLAQGLAQMALARERQAADQTADAAQQALAARLQQALQATTDRLLAGHGIVGQARADFLQRAPQMFDLRARVDEKKVSVLAGVVGGVLTGLKADLASGGLTLGGGMLAGGLLGALGAGGLARIVNVVRGTDQSWLLVADEAMPALVASSVLRYLAVAHFGRGRGQWVQGEAPPHWPATVAAALAPQQAALQALWAARDPKARAPDPAPLAQALQPLLAAAVRDALARLYPAATHNPPT
jgi:Domain of unknown function (DUF3482)/50S ribosome-binding GTPase